MNQALETLHGGSLEISRTVPLMIQRFRSLMSCYFQQINICNFVNSCFSGLPVTLIIQAFNPEYPVYTYQSLKPNSRRSRQL